jgi:hypothetical protein
MASRNDAHCRRIAQIAFKKTWTPERSSGSDAVQFVFKFLAKNQSERKTGEGLWPE